MSPGEIKRMAQTAAGAHMSDEALVARIEHSLKEMRDTTARAAARIAYDLEKVDGRSRIGNEILFLIRTEE